jgi:hypothetical protein
MGVDSNSLGLAPHQRYDTFLASTNLCRDWGVMNATRLKIDRMWNLNVYQVDT